MSALLCPHCGEDLAAWLKKRKSVVVAFGAFIPEEPKDPAIGVCPQCRGAFVSDAAAFIRPASESDIHALHPMNRAVLADYLRGADLEDQMAAFRRHGPVAS